MEIYYNEIGIDSCEIDNLSSDDKIVDIPEEIDGRKIVDISIFSMNTPKAEKIIFPSTLEKLYSGNIDSIETLKEVDLSKTKIKILNDTIFSDLPNLETVLLPENCEEINCIFDNCPNLKTLKIPPSVTKINGLCKDGNIDTLIIGKNCKEIKFSETTSILNLEIDKSNNEIIIENNCIYSKDKSHLFYIKDKEMEELILDDKTTKLNDNIFCNCKIKKIDLKNIEEIPKMAFTGSKIKTLIANNVKKCEVSAFSCSKIQNIELNSLSFVPMNCFLHSKLENLSLDNCKTIDDNAFYECELNKFICPKKLSVINESAFEKSTLKEIVFNEGLQEIGSYAFSECLKESIVKIPSSVKIINNNAFDYSEKSSYFLNKNTDFKNAFLFKNHSIKECENITLNVPNEQIDAYTARTCLEGKKISGHKTLEELISSGITFKDASKILKQYKEEER